MAEQTYERVAELPLEVDGFDSTRLEQPVSSGFTRVTTVIRLRGGGEEGVGEDVTYEAGEHASWALPPLNACGSFGEVSELLEEASLFAHPQAHAVYANYRRWGIESAALDLALRQRGVTLAQLLEREPRPVRFVCSTRLGDPSSSGLLLRWLELYPELRFKLDPALDWDEALVAELAATGAVDVVDLKGAYHGTVVDLPPSADLYARVADGFPQAWLEDPALTSETDPVLEPHRDRITWDAIIHSVDDVERLPFAPRALNCKPSRFGSVRALLAFYAYCEQEAIRLYGGGQFELGPGRGQIQYLSSLFHADEPNDVAPTGYNVAEPQPGLPVSPLQPAAAATGFRWGAEC